MAYIVGVMHEEENYIQQFFTNPDEILGLGYNMKSKNFRKK